MVASCGERYGGDWSGGLNKKLLKHEHIVLSIKLQENSDKWGESLAKFLNEIKLGNSFLFVGTFVILISV